MKLIAWNVGHQTRERPIKEGFADAIQRLAPDLLVLNEYVHGDSRTRLLEDLKFTGLEHVLVSERHGEHNQVLIACRYPLVRGSLRGPKSCNGAAESNFLHVRIPETGIEVVGMRVPAYRGADLHTYWRQLLTIVRSSQARCIVFIGDLNTDPESARRPTARYLHQLRKEGWTIPAPSGAWSYVKGTRIDHAVASRFVRVLSAQYITTVGELTLASEDSAVCLSDHAALVVQVVQSGGTS